MDLLRQVIVFDAADLHAESAFWAGMFDGRVLPDGDWRDVVDADDRWVIGVQLAPDHVPPDWPAGTTAQQIHLDLHVRDHPEAREKALRLGARLLQAPQDPTAAEGFEVLADPAGHPFCLCWGQPDDERVRQHVRRRLEG